jgi:hypothetical protein
MSLKDRIENNVTVWLLGSLLTGFLAGIGTYKAILEIAHLKVVSASEYKKMNQASSTSDEVHFNGTKATSVTLTPGYTVLIPGLNIGAKLDSGSATNFNPKTKAVRIWFAFPKNDLGTITEQNKSDSDLISFVEYWLDTDSESPISMGGLGSFLVTVKDYKFNPNHSDVQRVTLNVKKSSS